MKTKYKYYIGIDTGANTGFVVWGKHEKKILEIKTVKIHRAMLLVKTWYNQYPNGAVLVRIEDARLRKWLPKNVGPEQLQGAGSIKRDATIWEDFLKDLGIDYEMVAPKDNKTKMDAEYFKRLTGWAGITNEHMRDAAMLVFGK